MTKEKGHLKAAQKNPCSYFADLSAEAQRARLLDALRCGPITTIEARRNLDILMPAARVHELKHRYGYDIQKVIVQQETEGGRLHRVAKYVLMAGGVSHG